MDDETKVDVTSDEFRDDSSTALGLGHHASKSRSGGINRYFEAEIEQRKENEKADRERLREVERDAYKLGVKLVEPPESSNRDAHEVDGHEREKAADREYLDDSIANLMGTNRRIHAGGGGGNKTQFREEPIFDTCPRCSGCGKVPGKPKAINPNRVVSGDPTPEPCKRCKGTGKVKTGSRTVQVQLLGAKSAGGGGGGGKMKQEKKPGSKDAGEPVILASYVHTIEPEARSERFIGRMSESTAEGILAFQEQTGVNVAGIVAAVARMQESDDPNVQLALEMLVQQVPVREGKSKAS